MAFKILIMGISGSGKTTFAKKLYNELLLNSTVCWMNADVLRTKHNDWDFSIAGRLRQSQRFCDIASVATEDYVICDFIAPIPESREIYSPNYTIWMNTISHCKYNNTNKLFTNPLSWEYRIPNFKDSNKHIKNIIADLGNI